MSKSRDSRPPEGYHQEYIASLRYRNDLPPPEMPPKFLEIPHEGLERFLTPGFASNLWRREEPNIDVDAEGGMHIDLVGIPGLHLGDESAIMAPENPPPLDPADLPLLMSLDQLRNPAPKNSNVSFLRRTQYIASSGASRNVETKSFLAPKPKVQKPKPSRDDPAHIKKYILKGFDIAYPNSKHIGEDTESRIRGLAPTKAEVDAWANPVHPDNSKLKPVGFYPLIPDLTGFSDHGGYLQVKFDKAPVQADNGKRDDRMDIAILVPTTPEDRVVQEHATKQALHKANPSLYPDPGPLPFDYDLFLPERKGTSNQIKKSLNIVNPDRDNPDHYTHEGPDGQRFHRYDRVRTYATTSQVLNVEQKYKDVAVVLFDPEEGSKDKENFYRLKQKGAYYSPILSKLRLKPERSRTIAQAGLAPTLPQDKSQQLHQIQLVVRDPTVAESYKRASHRAQLDPKFAKNMPPPPEEETSAPAENDHEMADVQSEKPDEQGKTVSESDRKSESGGGTPKTEEDAAEES
ncbi:hypothetical protein VTO42DRAFT_3407 [Malbranchea cinnamomea]